MPITAAQAKNLKDGDQIVVTRTGEVWTITGSPTTNRDPRKVTLKINNGRVNSFIDETRLHLFNLHETPPAPSLLPSAEEAAEQLRPGMEAAYKEFKNQEELEAAFKESALAGQKEIPEEEIRPRIEDHFTEEPELTKPARKARTPREAGTRRTKKAK